MQLFLHTAGHQSTSQPSGGGYGRYYSVPVHTKTEGCSAGPLHSVRRTTVAVTVRTDSRLHAAASIRSM